MGDTNDYPKLGGQDAGYLFEFKDDGVYLTIYPNTADSLLFELSDMRQILRESGVTNYDVATLSRTVREASGIAQKIADPIKISTDKLAKVGSDEAESEDEQTDNSEEAFARIIVDISRDKMKATVRYDTKKGSRLPTFDMVMDELKALRITNGIDEEEIKRSYGYFKPYVAAQGQPPITGDNAYIDRKFDLGEKGRPVVDEYDRVDYKNLNLFVLVKANETLAIRIPQTKGTPGKNIYGEVVPAQNGRPIPMPVGKNTKVIGENQLVAAINGQIVDTGNKISVDPRLEIQSSVGVGTGNIEFDGTVIISGDVQQGFFVKATGDIEIRGSVNGAEIVGRNVLVGGGLTGAERGKIQSKENVNVGFVENAVIEAGGSINIVKFALHSTLRAGKRIILDGKQGQLMGGIAIAGEEVLAKLIGNQANVVTRVSVGIDPNLQQEYHEVCKNYKEGKKKLLHITQTLNTLSKIDINTLPQSRVDQINALTRSQFPIAGQLKRDEKRIKELEEKLADMKHGKVRAEEAIFPGVRLSINKVNRNVQEKYSRCTMYLEDGEVTLGPF